MRSGYDADGKPMIRTANGAELIGDNTHAEVTDDMKRINRIFKQEEESEEDIIRSKLADLGIEVSPRMGLKNLKKKLKEAEEK